MKTTFTDWEVRKAHSNNKTLFSFQYIEGKNGKYVCEGSLVQVAEFLSGALAKILVESNITGKDLPDFMKNFSDRTQEIYKAHK